MRSPRSLVALCLLLLAPGARSAPAQAAAAAPAAPAAAPVPAAAHAPAATHAPAAAAVLGAAPAPGVATQVQASGMRLPRTVLPESNRVFLVLDPGKDTFSGHIEIAARAAEPVRSFSLHAKNLSLSEATLTAGGETWPLEIPSRIEDRKKETDVVVFRAPQEVPAGAVIIKMSFAGTIDATETEGIFRQKEGDDWYAFSQFEPIAARKAFPCFDEPDSKVPWQVTLEVPKGLVAVSNTPVVSEKDTDRGTRVVAFQETPPLPSYLVAFAVGPFDVVDGGRTNHGTPIRVVVTKGRGGDVRYVVDTTAPILAQLEDYFGMPYPFAKLDLLAIPLTVGFGAMENPGLVTFNQNTLTARREDFTIGFQRRYASVAAHELAHQWFGDLVTLAWWDDIWLNEAFATWMAGRVIDQWKPEWDKGVGGVTRLSGAIGSDSLQSTRRIRQPIQSENDIKNAFDGITYQKGASVIRMFERWIGEDKFRDGVRAYLRKYSRKNATAADFLETIGETVGRDVATPFSTFLDRPGAPLVSFHLACEKDRAPVLRMKQQRYLPLGSEAEADQTWQVPVCVRYPAGKGLARDCALVTEASSEMELTQAASCPAWVLPNDGGLGYYRSQLDGDLQKRLLERGIRSLSLPERVGVIGDVNALVRAGKADVGVALGLAARFAGDENRQVAVAAAGIAGGISDTVPDSLRPNYARFVRKTFGPRAHRLGWTPAKTEDDDTKLLRSSLLALVADEGEDRELAAEARKLSLAWLQDHSAVDPDMAGLVLETAAIYGDRALFDRFYEAAKGAKDRRDRQRLLGALSGFRDPDLARRATALTLTDEFDIRESLRLLKGAPHYPQNRRMVYDFVKQNYDALTAKLPKTSSRSLVGTAVSLCEASVRPDAAAFFETRMASLPGGPRDYDQAMEQLDLCVKQREAQRPSIAAFLAKY